MPPAEKGGGGTRNRTVAWWTDWTSPPDYDRELYKARSEVECTFNLLKQARRFATRYEKTLRNYSSVVALGCAILWLRI